MPYISADELTNPILKKIAAGDESVFVDAKDNEFNIDEVNCSHSWSSISLACNNGHISIVNRLLEMPSIVDNETVNNRALYLAAENGHLSIVNRLLEISKILAHATATGQHALCSAAKNGHLSIVNRLLEIPAIRSRATFMCNRPLHSAVQNGHLDIVNRFLAIPQILANAAFVSNYSFLSAAERGHVKVVHRLLEIPAIAENLSYNDNYALRMAAENGHTEIAYILANLQWPRGVVDMPAHLHNPCLSEIYQGAVIASGRKEFESMVKCWMLGNPASSTSNIHYPSHDSFLKDFVRIDKYNAPRAIMQYAECRDVIKEAQDENGADHGMNTLLYSSRLHKTFQAAYKKGQKESSGYGEGAMVVYSSNKLSRPDI